MTVYDWLPTGVGFVPYVAAVDCTSGPQRGVVAFAEALFTEGQSPGAYNLGIYNCRKVAGSDTLSVHGEGRAIDIGWDPLLSQSSKETILASFIGAPALGIQRLIHYRELYDATTPRGRPYTGPDPHTGHAHVEFGWATAQTLTRAAVDQVLTHAEWSDMATKEELKAAFREVLNEGTADGQLTWKDTNRVLVKTVQAVYNLVNR